MGMQRWLCMEQYRDGYWLVNFPQLGENPDIATLGIKEEDLKVVPIVHVAVNEEIKARFEDSEQTKSSVYINVHANAPALLGALEMAQILSTYSIND